MAIRTFNNDGTGIAVMVEDVAGGFGGYKLTHVSYEADVPDSNNTIEVRTYGAGQLALALEYAKLCTSDTVPAGTFISVNC